MSVSYITPEFEVIRNYDRCISCRICEKNCPAGAVAVDGAGASIDYSKCIGCGLCESKCPRHIIWRAVRRDGNLIMSRGGETPKSE